MTAQSAAFLDDLAPGSAMTVSVTAADGSDLLLALVRAQDGSVYALDDECSHGRASLGDGDVLTERGVCSVECWKHGSRFDVTTGRPLGPPASQPVTTYPVTIDGEIVLVDVDSPVRT
ncbi:MAG TPA: (2Fe-2S)-binding protein [Micrococcales bacterium]|uniref:Non-heme iron oxygenase ferredoxin subunit n=1 Tax=Miniimonas arenae TaxID=676201 RepID=A0A5C5BD67_9MICO|nr:MULTISPECIES: non-heme iron oxygenase ferredoxin subunit [Miniimonas]TNU76346.1 non-heme iron oxygenase ferredoxin subunit [Miniimonas arenae]HCX84336.1 (2Fe-2S)-binding protein [Micrococcales bacterium]